jgi:hypothetical protein
MDMKPGRELDALISKKVMGIKHEDVKPIAIGFKTGEFTGPYYSTDIAAAWDVVEKLSGYDFEISKDYDEVMHNCLFRLEEFIESDVRNHTWQANGESAPHAICLAALRAIET